GGSAQGVRAERRYEVEARILAPVPRRAREHANVELGGQRIELAGKRGRERQRVARAANEQKLLPHELAARASSASISPNTAASDNPATDAGAAADSRARSSESEKNREIAAARAAASPGGTRSPFSSFATTSGTPPTAVAITGQPTASASRRVGG